MAEVMTLATAEDMFSLPDPYTIQDVKKAYRKLILEKHPDVRKDVDPQTANKEASQLNAANKLLMRRFEKNNDASVYRQNSSQHIYTQQNVYDPDTFIDDPLDYEIPVEDVSWSDLVDDFYEFYRQSVSAKKNTDDYVYSSSDFKREAAAGAAFWAAKKVAKHFDTKNSAPQDDDVTEFQNNTKQSTNTFFSDSKIQKPVDNIEKTDSVKKADDYLRHLNFERSKRIIDILTGRIAVLVLLNGIGWAMINAVQNGTAFDMLPAFLMSVILFLASLVNLIFPIVSSWLRAIPYGMLNSKYDGEFEAKIE